MNLQGNDQANHPLTDHQIGLAARDLLVREVNCPRCGQIAGTACVGTGDDVRHAGEFLDFHHVQRLEAAALKSEL